MTNVNKDALGDRMKEYEKAYSPKCMPLLPICVRLDGKNFSKWTKGLNRPFDLDLTKVMVETTKELVKETQAVIGYTQSDEISLIYYSNNNQSQVYFDGKIHKMIGDLAVMSSNIFNSLTVYSENEKFKSKKLARFDCRVWQVPTLQEAVNVLVWRELDATKNSITMAASSVYSHKQLHKKNGKEKMDMLMEKGINWNDYPYFFKRGTYVRKVCKQGTLTSVEFENLPEKHNARFNPDFLVKRNVIISSEIPKITSIANPVDVIFNGAEFKFKNSAE